MAVPFETKESYNIYDLLHIMRVLRGDGGCPWDREQTHESIRMNFIEETYEVIEAIDNRDTALLKEELGDVLLQVVYHAAMEEEEGNFDFDGVADGICKKLIHRHPHIFSDAAADTAAEVLDVWEAIKREEKGQATVTETLESVPKVFPALMRAAKIKKRASKGGFDYDNVWQAIEQVESEIAELKEAIQAGGPEEQFEEYGDLLFATAGLSRHLKIEPEDSLTAASDKFIARFSTLEMLCIDRQVNMKEAPLELLISLWKEAKDKE